MSAEFNDAIDYLEKQMMLLRAQYNNIASESNKLAAENAQLRADRIRLLDNQVRLLSALIDDGNRLIIYRSDLLLKTQQDLALA